MTKLSVLTVSILALCVRPIQSAGHDFTLGLRGPKNVFAGGPIPITLALTYGGVQPISVGSIEYSLRHVHFSTPDGWESRQPAMRITIDGGGARGKRILLKKGDIITHEVFLHDFFSKIVPGRAMLRATLEINRFEPKRDIIVKVTRGGGEDPTEDPIESGVGRSRPGSLSIVRVEGTVELKVRKDSSLKLRTRISEIASRIHSSMMNHRDPTLRLQLYRSLLNLPSDSVAPVLLQSLADQGVRRLFRTEACRRLLDIYGKLGTWGPLVEHLAKHGGIGDTHFIFMWNANGVTLSSVEIGKLAVAKSPWIRLYCLEYLRSQAMKAGVHEKLVDSLRKDAKGDARLAGQLRKILDD